MTSALYPLDGPHYPETVIAAAHDVEHLVHYLTLATRHRTILNNPGDASTVIGALHQTATMLFQLFDQMAQHADRWVDRPGLYDHRGDDPGYTATNAGLHLRGAAAGTLPVAAHLAAAHEAVSRLGTRPKEN